MKNTAVRVFALALALLMITALFPLSAFATEPEEETGGETGHVCVFDQENTADVYLASAAGCTEPAFYYYSCICGQACTDTFAYGEILGHDFSVEIAALDPTCTEAGYSAHFKCSRCDETQGKETVPALGHDFTVEVPALAPTCTEAGYNAHLKCSRCDETQGKETVPAVGHDFSVEVPALASTCTEAGYNAHRKCSVCGETEGKEALDALGHEWEDGVCARCGAVCAHEEVSDSVCTVCGAAAAAPLLRLGTAGGKTETVSLTVTVEGKGSVSMGEEILNLEEPLSVEKGAPAALTFTPDEGWALASLTVNGEETACVGGVWSAEALTENTELAVTFASMTQVQAGGYAVPDALKENETFNTVEKIQAAMLERAQAAFPDAGDALQLYAYDIHAAMPDGSPLPEQIPFLLEYPDGLSAEQFDFAIFHLTDKGELETLPVDAQEDGIHSASRSFSPVSLAAAPKAPQADRSDGDNALSVRVTPTENVKVGDTLTATVTPEGTAVHYQWSNGEDIGSDQNTYTVTEADVDKPIVCTVTEITEDPEASPRTAASDPVTPAAAAPAATLTITPAAVKSGDTLTAAVDPADTDVQSYQWLSGGSPIAGATYRPKLVDVGKAITCQATTADGSTITSANSVTPTAADAPAAPAVKKDKDVINDGAAQLGRISGTSAEMEYAASPDAATWTTITGSSFTVAAPGTYYVRYKATEYIPAGVSAQVTVDGYYTISTRVLYGHGSIRPMRTLATDADGNYLVKAGDDVVFVFTGSLNYSVANVRVDGQSAGAPRTYTFRKVWEPYELAVGFKYTGIGPRTGDSSRIELWCGAEALSILALAAVALILRKHGKARS